MMSHVLQCKQFEIAYLLLAFHARARLLIRTTRFYRQSDNPHVMWHTVKAPCQASSSGREGDSAASDTDPDVRRRETSRYAESSEKPARQRSPRAVEMNALRSSVAALAFLGTAQLRPS